MMGWFTPKCPRCGGPLQATGYSAPYPSHRCPACIADSARDEEIKQLRARIDKLDPQP